jgi:hypothetical protein
MTKPLIVMPLTDIVPFRYDAQNIDLCSIDIKGDTNCHNDGST